GGEKQHQHPLDDDVGVDEQSNDREGCSRIVHDYPLPFISWAYSAHNIARRRWQKRDADRGDFVETAWSEALRQPGQEGAARTELRGKDPKALAGTNLVDLVKQVDDVRAQFHTLEDPGRDRLDDAEIHLLIARQAATVRDGASRPQAAALDEVGGKTGA